MACINELAQDFYGVEYDSQGWNWIVIPNFPLPDTFYQDTSPLMIKTPGPIIENFNGYDFYMNLDLSRLDNQQSSHLIDGSGYNDLGELGWTKLSFHLQEFNPAYPTQEGDTLMDILQSLYHFLEEKW